MAFRVELTERAARDQELLFLEIHAEESEAAARWFNRLEKAIDSLGDMPERNPVAPESRNVKRPIRHLLFGRKPNVYRVLYRVLESRNTVVVLHIRHGARRPGGG